MPDPVITGIISSGIFEGSREAVRRIRRRVSDHPEVWDDVGETFEESLRDTLNERRGEVQDNSLDQLLDDWQTVVERLNSTDAVFSEEERAVTHVTEVLLSETDNPDNSAEVRRVLRTVVAEAMENAVDEFESQVKKSGMFEDLSMEADISILQQLDAIQSQLDTIAHRARYSQFYTIIDAEVGLDPSRVKENIADRLNADIGPRYVPLPESDSIQNPGRYLILGRRGAGKSRLLIEAATTLLRSEAIRYLVIPHRGFSASAALDALIAETFDDDTLLVWDDIHDITSIERSDPFRETVMKLEEISTGEVSVIATARSEHYDELPGIDRWKEDRLWSNFARIDLQSLSEATVPELIDSVWVEDSLLEESIKERLVEKILATDPTPFYTVSATRILQDISNPSVLEVDTIPPTGIEIWEEQYSRLRDIAPEARRVLMAINLLDTFSVPLLPELVRVTAEQLFDLKSLEFEPTVEDLIDRQWLEVRNWENDVTEFTIHRIQISAIENLRWGHVDEFSNFTLQEMEEHIRGSDSFFAQLHHYMGLTARRELGTDGANLAINHFERAIELDPQLAMAHSSYGISLAKRRNPEEGLEHLQAAAEMAPQDPTIRYNLGVMLIKLGRSGEAFPHLKKAAELLPDFPWVHSSLAMGCIQLDKHDRAIKEAEKALSLDPSLPHPYFTKAEAHYFQGDLKKTFEPSANARSLLREQGRYINLLRVLQLSARVAADLREYEEALHYCEEGFDVVDKLESNDIRSDFRFEDETIDIRQMEGRLRDIYLEVLEFSL